VEKNWRKGESDLFLLEACEYRKSFSYYHPRVILLTNADGDHFDYYKSIDEYHRAFIEFIQLLPEDGVLITHMADPECAAIANTCGKNVIDADEYPLIQVQTPGMHMKQNAQLVLGLASYLKIPLSEAIKMVSQFTGSWRRMERKGTVNGAIVIDDYAHHPKEIRATISGIREWYTPRRLVCVFQPHTHDRTLKLYDEFVRSFSGADLVLITDVYEARKDIETAKVDIEAFSRDIQKYCKSEVVVTGSLESTEKYLKKNIQENDVLLCMGAGDITAMANTIIDAK
jgi:UDP-N-acetylmuramate--alanine ligase